MCTYSGPPKRYFLSVEAVSMVVLIFFSGGVRRGIAVGLMLWKGR